MRSRAGRSRLGGLAARLAVHAGRGLASAGNRLEGVGTDHRSAVGGLWEEVGRLQLDFLRRRGLEPEHRLLDVGCGSLRAGVHLVGYLAPGNYFGLDIDPRLIERGRAELAAAGLAGRDARLIVDDGFRFERLGTGFDFAIAHSLFTHLAVNSIHTCLVKVSEALREGGSLYATFFEQRRGRHDLREEVWTTEGGASVRTWPDRDPFHYPAEVIAELCRGLPLDFEYLGDWGHPFSQRMLRFTRVAGVHGS